MVLPSVFGCNLQCEPVRKWTSSRHVVGHTHARASMSSSSVNFSRKNAHRAVLRMVASVIITSTSPVSMLELIAAVSRACTVPVTETTDSIGAVRKASNAGLPPSPNVNWIVPYLMDVVMCVQAMGNRRGRRRGAKKMRACVCVGGGRVQCKGLRQTRTLP
jgi:hypothetical protein